MSVHHIGLEAIHHIAQSSNEPGVRNRRRKRTLGVDVNAWQDGRPLLEPMNDDPVLGRGHVIRPGAHRCHCDIVAARREGSRQPSDVPLQTSDGRWVEVTDEKNSHTARPAKQLRVAEPSER